MQLRECLFLGLSSVLFVSACRTTSSSSSIKHDLGRALNDESPYQWHETSDDEYFRVLGRRIEATKADAVAEDHPAMKRLQFWVDAVDTMLRTRDPRKLETVPKPKVKLVRSKTINAHVAPIKICLRLGVVISGQENHIEADTLQFLRTKGSFQELSTLGPYCVKSTMTNDQEIAMAAWQFSAYPQCNFEVRDGVASISKDCISNVYSGRFKHLAVEVTSNIITVYSGLMSLLTEDQMIETLAHELGHYYMSVGTTPLSTYGQFYQLKAQNSNAKPRAEPEAELLGKRVWSTINAWVDFTQFSPVDGQLYHSGLYKTMSLMAYKLKQIQCGTFTECQTSCSIFLKTAGDPLLAEFPNKALSPAGVLAYKEFERNAEACFARINLSDQLGISGAISYDEVSTYIGTYGADLIAILNPLTRHDNLATLFRALTLKIQDTQKNQESNFAKLVKEVIDFNLAQYTFEQEADELALEWVDQLGVNPAVGIDSIIRITKVNQSDQPLYPGEVDASRCEYLSQHNWKDENGNYVIVPVGTFSDPHHSGCFRAFNMYREIAVHNLEAYKSKERPQPEGPKWEELVQMITTSDSTPTLKSNGNPK